MRRGWRKYLREGESTPRIRRTISLTVPERDTPVAARNAARRAVRLNPVAARSVARRAVREKPVMRRSLERGDIDPPPPHPPGGVGAPSSSSSSHEESASSEPPRRVTGEEGDAVPRRPPSRGRCRRGPPFETAARDENDDGDRPRGDATVVVVVVVVAATADDADADAAFARFAGGQKAIPPPIMHRRASKMMHAAEDGRLWRAALRGLAVVLIVIPFGGLPTLSYYLRL